MTTTFLVTGGTGRLGSLVVDRLRQAGHDVRVTSRRSGPGLRTVDWKTGVGLVAALDGVEVVVHTATSHRNVDMERALAEAAADADVSHLLFISVVGIDRIPIKYYRLQVAAERIIEQSGVPYTIQRATQFHDYVRSVFDSLARLPVMLVPDVSFQSVDHADVAERLAALALAPPAGRVADMGGPEIMKATDMARMYLRSTGRHRAVVPFRAPGRAFGGLRAGYHLAPEHADGRITFADYLAARSDDQGAPDRSRS
ncbi:SDR family oxidoreductase [Jiangella mangrovi]|uniref:Uncharacterized protein YbjT (DUF2867 family) n=1 Tax=Jiangella mangrovi TaxID=1524084 RepID=A0A7W9GUN0_9ACTN|nr:SDR family oxidoreductase [Jiangella mangrovi]MBB5790354.1 uncharacterized protein YbjT (DUF2867 family) [Jiangella mangrovi]